MIFENISYGKHERHIADLFIPEDVKYRNGMIFIIHGGGWNSCDKSAHRKDLEYWYDSGYICAAINYRYISETIHIPDLLDDITSALKFLKEKCAENGFFIENVIMSGGSAGAHLCLMYGFTRLNEAPISPVAIMNYCGPVDFTQPDFMKGINGEFDDWKYGTLSHCIGATVTKDNVQTEEIKKKMLPVSPITYAEKNTIPIIFGHGKKDVIVPYNQAVMLAEILKKNKVDYDFITFENSGHELDKDADALKETKEVVRKYAEKFFE